LSPPARGEDILGILLKSEKKILRLKNVRIYKAISARTSPFFPFASPGRVNLIVREFAFLSPSPHPPPARGGEILGDPKFPPPGWA